MEHNNTSLAKKETRAEMSVVEGRKAAHKKNVSRKKSPESVRMDQRKKAGNKSEDGFEKRTKRRDEERARRKEERMRKVRRQKIIMAVSGGIIAAAGAGAVVFCLPSMQLSRSLARGEKLTSQAEYAGAQDAFEAALKIDTASVEAYHGMANNYLAQQKTLEAEEIYYAGWEQTQDEKLLDYYCTLLLNEAVAEINDKNCSLATVAKCIQVLETEPANEDALKLMGTCYERLFRVSDEHETCEMFYDADASQDTCGYVEYEQLMHRLLAIHQANPSEEIGGILRQYALIDMPYVRISIPHMEQYMTLLTQVNDVVNDGGITETLACLARAKEVEDYFAKAFTEFAAGNYAYAREVVSDETYQQIRDDFIAENSGYWEGSVYIPVNSEQMVLHNEDGRVRFSFLGEEDCENHKGIISVWGTKQEDDGVQRSVISYEPAADSASGGQTVYKVQYLYSNVKINGAYVPQMNYRFDTEVTTQDGITTNAIGDWGGEHEWEIDY